MPRPRSLRIALALACLLFGIQPLAQAGTRAIEITSDPAGARVYLLKGFKQQPIGTTPLEHSFSVRSEQSILRIRVEKSGYHGRTVSVSGSDKSIAVDLDRIPLFDPESDGAGIVVERDRLLEAFAPWSLEGPATVTQVEGRRLLSFPLASAEHRPNVASSTAVAARAAPLFDGIDGQSINGVLLVFKWRSVSGVSTSVGTRLQTEMACEGAMVPTPVWDNCASRSTTTSTTTTGTKTEYRCVGGTVTRMVWNNCARRVAKQKQVVDLKANVDSGTHDNAIVQVVAASPKGMRAAGHCERRNGRVISSSGEDSSELVRAVCR